MSYDLEELRGRIKDMRERFIRRSAWLLALLTLSAAAAVAFDETTVRFICVAAGLVFLSLLIGNIRKSRPVSLFSREVRGKNVKEHEYVIRGRRAYSRYLGFYMSRKSDPATPRGIIGVVYILEDSGDVIIVDRLHKAHTDIYEDGDTLLKPEGARFPIVVGRAVKKQPCPLCGEVNALDDVKCKVCGLGIVK